jgi:hypothetical protein
VTDYDRTHRMLSVSKARVDGIDKDCTKTNEDRCIKLCRRAVLILERQLRLRDRLVNEGRINHNYLFVTDEGRPIPDVKYPYPRWEQTLRRLKMRYRRPYAARHTSVSWNLMLVRNALLVAKEHGHRPLTMLTVYAAWTEGATEHDIRAIRAARNPKEGKTIRHSVGTSRSTIGTDGFKSSAAPGPLVIRSSLTVADRRPIRWSAMCEAAFGTQFGTSHDRAEQKPLKSLEKQWRSGRDSNPRPPA